MKKVIWMMVLSLVILSGCGQQTESETLTTEPGSVAQEATLCTPTADEELLAGKVYTYEAQDTD
jgi:lipoprotein NlpI